MPYYFILEVDEDPQVGSSFSQTLLDGGALYCTDMTVMGFMPPPINGMRLEALGSDFPVEDDVRDGVGYGDGTYEGNLVLPAESDVKLGVQYGANGTEFEGEYAGGGGGATAHGFAF